MDEKVLGKLEKQRITPESDIPKREFLFRMFGVPCFAKGELVALTGKEKSGKTFVCSLLMALCQRRKALSFERVREGPMKVLWYDTEQSEESTQEILVERIMRLAEVQTGSALEWIDAFNVRSVPWVERLALFKAAVEFSRPDFVVLDGIRDLMDDINDIVLSQQILDELMKLASEWNCCILCVLHQNKALDDKNLRGSIGTELAFKAFEVFECTKNAERLFTFVQTRTRKFDITGKLQFTVGGDGLPVECTKMEYLEGKFSSSSSSSASAAVPAPVSRRTLNLEYVVNPGLKNWSLDWERLFTDAMEGGKEYLAEELKSLVMDLGGIMFERKYVDCLEKAVAAGVVEEVDGGRAYVRRAQNLSI